MRTRPAILLTSLAILIAPPATAEEICVVCSWPDATYQCTVAEADKMDGFRGADRALSYVCATELARQGAHQKCRARRKSAEPCIGTPVTVSVRAQAEALAHTGPSQPEASAGAAEAQPAQDAPPKTMVELAKRTADASQEQFKKAGDAVKDSAQSVGGAMKKSWTCVVSLFKEC